MKYSLSISNFLEDISSLSYSIVFFYLFTLISWKGFLISTVYSLGISIQVGISFLLTFASPFSLFSVIFKDHFKMSY